MKKIQAIADEERFMKIRLADPFGYKDYRDLYTIKKKGKNYYVADKGSGTQIITLDIGDLETPGIQGIAFLLGVPKYFKLEIGDKVVGKRHLQPLSIRIEYKAVDLNKNSPNHHKIVKVINRYRDDIIKFLNYKLKKLKKLEKVKNIGILEEGEGFKMYFTLEEKDPTKSKDGLDVYLNVVSNKTNNTTPRSLEELVNEFEETSESRFLQKYENEYQEKVGERKNVIWRNNLTSDFKDYVCEKWVNSLKISEININEEIKDSLEHLAKNFWYGKTDIVEYHFNQMKNKIINIEKAYYAIRHLFKEPQHPDIMVRKLKQYIKSPPAEPEPISDYPLPDFITEVPEPNEILEYKSTRTSRIVENGKKSKKKDYTWFKAEFYGTYNGHPFNHKDIKDFFAPKILCIHDASHSVAMFLEKKENCDFAMYNYIPMVYPNTKEYVLYYSQKYDYPLVVTSRKDSYKNIIIKRGMVNTLHRRYCTKETKIKPTYYLYLFFNIKNPIQYLGITKMSAVTGIVSGRAEDYVEGIGLDLKWRKYHKTFPVFSYLPIRPYNLDKQIELIKSFNIEINPNETKFEGLHGCFYCPYRPEWYYHFLKRVHPKLYKKANEWRKVGSRAKTEKGEGEYYFYRESKIM